jgi:hypothetical protein
MGLDGGSLIKHSRRTLGIIRQNIAASLGVKVAFVALTLAGHASLWAAIAADMGVSLLVVFNALRLLGDGRRQYGSCERTTAHSCDVREAAIMRGGR